MDFAFLSTQTFTDTVLEREVLALFVAQGRRLIALLPDQTAREQADTAHLLKGSARGIGAWPMADAAEKYEQAQPAERRQAHADLQQAFDQADTAILQRLAALGG